ncbi:hypothetical protein M9H77_07430 [Catharanthus roseus]|uniref:Uncharacterized protein n=1 Tax=Catharanthus roseus TaxID=4058 RepID=A0ACC0BUY6_CATRO|nr:hypothetical protein M9H77_07430 [Catharanthus roseus]
MYHLKPSSISVGQSFNPLLKSESHEGREDLKEDVDPEIFEKFIEMEKEYIFDSKTDLVNWASKRAKTVNTYLIIIRYMSKRRFGSSSGKKKKANLDDDDEDEEEELPVKHKGPHNMPLLEAVEMTPTGKTFTVATTFMRNEKVETYEWVLIQLLLFWKFFPAAALPIAVVSAFYSAA